MTKFTDPLRAANLALARRWMPMLNGPGWWTMIHDDVVLEFPNGPLLGGPERIIGKPAVTAYLGVLFERIAAFKFTNVRVVGTHDPELFVSEYDAELTATNGRRYVQTCINKLRFRDGKLILMREFWDAKGAIVAAKSAVALAS